MNPYLLLTAAASCTREGTFSTWSNPHRLPHRFSANVLATNVGDRLVGHYLLPDVFQRHASFVYIPGARFPVYGNLFRSPHRQTSYSCTMDPQLTFPPLPKCHIWTGRTYSFAFTLARSKATGILFVRAHESFGLRVTYSDKIWVLEISNFETIRPIFKELSRNV